MTKEKDFYWIKLQEHFFEDDKIIYLMSQENGEKYVIFWIKLLLKCLKNKDSDNKEYAFLRFTDKIPYDNNLLSKVLNTDIDTVRVAIEYFLQLDMVEILDDKTIYIETVNKMIGKKDSSTERVRRHRERKKLLLQNETDVTKCNVTNELYKEVELDINKEEEKDNKPDSIESLSFYCPYCFNLTEYTKLSYDIKIPGFLCGICNKHIDLKNNCTYDKFKELCKSMNKNYKYYTLAELLYKEHLKSDDKYLHGKDQIKTFLRWANDIRLLCETDGRDRDLVKEIIIWCQQHEGNNGFSWKNNILSGKKLREKFPTLYGQYIQQAQRNESFNGYRKAAQEIIQFFNQKCKTNYSLNDDNVLRYPTTLLKNGYSKGQCFRVIDIMNSRWKRNTDFKQNLRPSVLFKPGKFPEYLTLRKWQWYEEDGIWKHVEKEY